MNNLTLVNQLTTTIAGLLPALYAERGFKAWTVTAQLDAFGGAVVDKLTAQAQDGKKELRILLTDMGDGAVKVEINDLAVFRVHDPKAEQERIVFALCEALASVP